MAVVKYHPSAIEGRWLYGVALDLHTISSRPIGQSEAGRVEFETNRTPLGDLLYRLKYRADHSAAKSIVDTAVDFLAKHKDKFDAIVPVPPSKQRALQPVPVLAEGIGEALNVPVLSCIVSTRSTAQLKNVEDNEERHRQVLGLYRVVDPAQTRGRNVLLFDDLFRSGTTMNAITDLLAGPGQVSVVRALTITKTRSNR